MTVRPTRRGRVTTRPPRVTTVSCVAPPWVARVPRPPTVDLAEPGFERLGVLGRGGSAEVFEALDPRLARRVALKVLHAALSHDPAEVQQFTEEAQVTGQLDHPNIVPVYQVGCDADGRPYMAMKVVEGETLDGFLRRIDDELPPAQALQAALGVLVKVCDAVAFAHERGVVHRDLKPENVMVGTHGQVYVTDWGVARLLAGTRPSQGMVSTTLGSTDREGDVVGTPAYMAPEQARGHVNDVGVRTDVFALGALLYQVLTDRPPFRGRDVEDELRRARRGVVVHPHRTRFGRHAPPGLCRVALRALSADPARRHPDVPSLRAELEAFMRGEGIFPACAFAPGQLVFQQGDAAVTAYIITSGRCQVFRGHGARERVLRELGPGDVFGETALLAGAPRTASVRASVATTALAITRDAVDDALGAHPWLGALVKALAGRFVELDAMTTRGGRR